MRFNLAPNTIVSIAENAIAIAIAKHKFVRIEPSVSSRFVRLNSASRPGVNVSQGMPDFNCRAYGRSGQSSTENPLVVFTGCTVRRNKKGLQAGGDPP